MAHGERRRRWWRDLRSVEAGRELRADRPAAVAALGDWMRRHEVDALGFCRIGKGSTPAMRCWRRAWESPVTMSGLMRLMEAYEWSRAGPEWGKIYGGVAHTDRGKVSAIIQYLLSRGRMRPHGVWHPRQVFRTMRKQVEGVLLKEPASQGYLQRYHRLAAKEWVRLAKVAQRMELARLEGLRREHEAREAARLRGESVVSDEVERG